MLTFLNLSHIHGWKLKQTKFPERSLSNEFKGVANQPRNKANLNIRILNYQVAREAVSLLSLQNPTQLACLSWVFKSIRAECSKNCISKQPKRGFSGRLLAEFRFAYLIHSYCNHLHGSLSPIGFQNIFMVSRTYLFAQIVIFIYLRRKKFGRPARDRSKRKNAA